MSIEIFIKLIISIVAFSSLVLLTFAIFKIPLLEHHRIITIISLVLGILSFYLRFIMKTPLFPLIIFLFFVVLLMVLKRYPIFYSFIVCGIGYVASVLIDAVVSIVTIQLGFNMEFIHTSIFHFTLLNSVVIGVSLLIAVLLKSFNKGFSFVIKKFDSRQVLKSSNFMWAGIIVICITIIQIANYLINVLSFHLYIFLGISVGLLFTLSIAYKQNRKSLRDRFGR